MIVATQTSSTLEHAYWLAVRGTQQLDLAERFASVADQAGLKVLALKGISIAQELYGAVENRPMADIDFLVVDTQRFTEVAAVARKLELVEIGASDHALVFKEPRSGVVLELHISLTACPGLFPIDHGGLWERRKTVAGAKFQRLSDADLLIHLSLHTAFQHGFVANEFHYRDFLLATDAFLSDVDALMVRAREGGTLPALAAMAHACTRRFPESQTIGDIDRAACPWCPPSVARWIEQWTEGTPPLSLFDLARLRFQLAPDRSVFIRKMLLPSPLPGRTLARPTPLRRIRNILAAALPPPAPTEQNPS